MALWLCMIALVASVVIGWRFKFNTGILAMAFAFLIGNLFMDLGVNAIVGYFPTVIVFYLIAISLFFSYCTQNGTMDVLSKKLLYALGGNAKLIPVAIAVVSAVVGGLGAGSSTPVIIGPFCFAMAIAAGVDPVLTTIAIGMGNIIGSCNPWNGYGGIISMNLVKDNLALEGLDAAEIATQSMSTAYHIWANFALAAFAVIVLFYFARKGHKGVKVAIEKPPAFNKVQKLNFIIVMIAFVFMVVPSILGAWFASNPVIAKLAGFFQPQVIMFIGAVVCAALKLGDERKVIKSIPINTIVMIIGVYSLIKVSAAAGLTDVVANALANTIPKVLVPAAIVLFAGFLSFFSSSTSTVMPLMYPLVPTLAATLSMNPVMLYTCVFFGGMTTCLSPFSTGGALTIASCPDNDVREALPNKMIVASIVILAFTIIWASFGLLGIF